MTRIALLCILAALLAPPAHAAAPASAVLISRQETASGVRVVYFVTGPAQPVVGVTAGRISGYTAVQDDTGWRATVNATLEPCHGALVVDGQTVTQQRCTWLPVGARQ